MRVISEGQIRVYSTTTGTGLKTLNDYNPYVFLGMDLDGDSRSKFVAQPLDAIQQPEDLLSAVDSPALAADPALFQTYGGRCVDSASQLATLNVSDPILPRIGRSSTLRLSGVPAAVPATLLVGFSRLDIDLSGFGIPCSLYTDFNPVSSFQTNPNQTALSIPIPNEARLVGGKLRLQLLISDPGSSAPIPFALSNAGEVTIGAAY